MRIGLDFDNTIVSYDALFHKVALEQCLIPNNIPINKIAVRDYLRENNQEPLWTELQGYVYGARMAEASAFPGIIPVLNNLLVEGHTLAIMSHKTKYPFIGEQYDLHLSAKMWIQRYLILNNHPLIADDFIYFELTQEKKLKRIEEFECDIFVDDLPEILLAETFPKKTRRILFDPEQNYKNTSFPNITALNSWSALANLL